MLVSQASLTRRPFNPEEHRQSGLGVVKALRGEQEATELSSVQPSMLRGMHGGAAHVLGRVGADPAVDVSEAVVTARGRQPAVDPRRGQATSLHRTALQLEMSPRHFEHGQVVIGGLLEQIAQIVPVGVQGSAAVAGQKRDSCQFGRIGGEPGAWPLNVRDDGCHEGSSL